MVVSIEVQSLDASTMSIHIDEPSSYTSSDADRSVDQMRDTSTTLRYNNRMDAPRTTAVNTERSILNITEDDDDDDDTFTFENEYLFPNLHDEDNNPVAAQEDDDFRKLPPVSCCSEPTASTLDQVTERFMEGLCGGVYDKKKDDKSLLEFDLFELLGCMTQPTTDELQQVWTCQVPQQQGPPRKCLKQRAFVLARLQQERALPNQQTGGVRSSATATTVSRVQSLPAGYISLEQRKTNAQDGYDSDPEHVEQLRSVTPENVSRPSKQRSQTNQEQQQHTTARASYHLDETNVTKIVQESLNLVWTLTHHTTKGNSCTRVWMERGAMLQNNYDMIEPRLSFRTALDALAAPQSIRLLNICRIFVPAVLDRTKYPLARQPCSFVVRTAENQDFLFEASCPRERDVVMKRWKHCVARFAALAVTEDVETIRQEFFVSSDFEESL
jgi:hypothetical protein